MASRKRDYKAEYARRQALAKERGFKSYGEQRRKIERGETRAIAPSRLRSRKTIENQNKNWSIFAEQPARNPVQEFFDSFSVRDARIDMASRWSDFYSRSEATKFDPERARRDERYLTVYMQAFVLADHSDRNVHDFDGSDWQREWFVDQIEYFEAEEYDNRYGEDA